ncbi:ubiquitin-protein ligase peroxin 12 [Orbilia oligospora]|uniref:Peroxisome assembly protein 12 n=1 Tax=Orbilia oligospora TaxID=2813651 RepID=A0A7C8UP90_ORBOL|nr:ubiquitin-protein ligase peroxin 12 [Orbilia oligospora]
MEFMSNISSGIDDNKPSLFELVSEQQLRDLLEPSIRYLLAIITQRYPRYLIHIVNRFDEAYAIAMLLVERHYLKAWNGSFTENFYGIKRERVLTVNELPSTNRTAPGSLREATKLGELDSWKALFVINGAGRRVLGMEGWKMDKEWVGYVDRIICLELEGSDGEDW